MEGMNCREFPLDFSDGTTELIIPFPRRRSMFRKNSPFEFVHRLFEKLGRGPDRAKLGDLERPPPSRPLKAIVKQFDEYRLVIRSWPFFSFWTLQDD